jgi:hypothetical protein
MTNLDSSVPLTLQRWGEYLGYQHDYVEGDSFFRQWWLANGQAMIFVTYSCRADQTGVENTAIDTLVDSLTAVAP